MAARHQRLLRRQGEIAGRLAHHPFDQIDAINFFGHRVLDLESRIHFQEIGFAALGIVDELDRAANSYATLLPRTTAAASSLFCTASSQIRRRRLLDDFLVAPLQRAVAGAERNHATAAVAENLHLDMARFGDEALEKKPGIAEISRSKPADAVVARDEFILAVAKLHADAAATGGAFLSMTG